MKTKTIIYIPKKVYNYEENINCILYLRLNYKTIIEIY